MAKNLSRKVANDVEKAILLLVDDDALITESLGDILSEKYVVIVAKSREEAQQLLLNSEPQPAIALIDLGLPPLPHQATEGFALIEDLLAHDAGMKILVLSEHNEYANNRHALTLGAADYVSKTEPALIQARLAHHLMLRQIEKKDESTNVESAIIGESKVMMALREKINQLSDSVFPILIEGESGTGKELIARCLHQESLRREKPFLVINCAAIAPELFEIKLFGRSNNAASDDRLDKNGFVAEAEDGSLFLDNIDEMPYQLQAKLLRLIDSNEQDQAADAQIRKKQVRIITASNKKIANEVKAGKFRGDLYRRLGMLTISVPALCERENDSLLLMRHFRRLYKDSIKPFTLNAAATALWMQYDFPGNIRELRNVVIRLGTKYTGTNINYDQLAEELELKVNATHPENIKKGFGAGKFNDAWLIKQISTGNFDLNESISDLESHCVQLAMKLFDNNLSKTAKALNINRTALYSRINKNDNKGDA